MTAKDSTLSSCFTLANLMRAASKCASSASWKRETQRFMAKRPTECERLRREIVWGTYEPTEAERFRIVERGKPRDVLPLAFRDRVAQRCFVDNALYDAFMRAISPMTSACAKGRGLSYAYEAVRSAIAAAPDGAWCVRYDFAGYFASIPREAACDRVSAGMDGEMGAFISQAVGGAGVGLELGSHVCQLLASAYPAPMDEAVSSVPGVVGYHRYMDDGIAVCDSRASAMAVLGSVRDRADALGLRINEKKTVATSLNSPVTFCKMRFAKDGDSCRMNVRKQQTRRSVRHAREVRRRSERLGGIDMKPVEASFLGYVNRGDVDLTRLLEAIR